MMMNRHFNAVMVLLCMAHPVVAAGHGHGHIQVQGSIIDTPCAIATSDADQSIELGNVPASELINDGHGPQVPFTVHLVNCVLNQNTSQTHQPWKDVRITFEGAADGPNLFALQGSGSGEGVAILDEIGTPVTPNQPVPPIKIVPGKMALHYRMQLMGDSHPLQPGSYYTTLRYFMEYD